MVFLFCILIDVSQMHLIKIALQCKWFFGVFQKECDEVKICITNLKRNPFPVASSLFSKALRSLKVIVCVNSFVKTCYRTMIRLYCSPLSNRTAYKGQKFYC